ncbi:tRNA dihydrouridine(20/20a) synthase DusA [Sinorhizobium sp. BG8]|uniref:tRNA dihydrouridine(20/20a) synthase DusA n=1 Tax=Sinorhizobium sp. BG8 TaxID=2613773 RepID=UPI00193C9841|nr:tRNA dihydrouridine(20/20a) synthase DusA [Sinorhizobium sp. BG8]QRM55747.1 tRNA dihydrouridine(20/20a) synthase DusA [Sinorhizobium sp. BG8]
MYKEALSTGTKIFATAPMIDWSDRHFRFFARQLSRSALLYTEMIVADAILRGNREKLLGFDDVEHPVALQLGGNDPQKLAEAARIGEAFGYDEINMNVGCPSDRVQSGTFGACLMREPQLVADCVSAMKAAVKIPVTVKCRIGVDDQDPEVALRDLVSRVRAAGVDAVWVHARKAWLQGLSPKENRDIPPLDYDLVRRLKAENANLFIGLNGGLHALSQALEEMNRGAVSAEPAVGQVSHDLSNAGPSLDGVMLGRAAYHDSGMLTGVDALFPIPVHGSRTEQEDGVAGVSSGSRDPAHWDGVRDAMMAYAERVMAGGGRLNHVTRHMVGLFQGYPGARRYRQILSSEATRPGAGSEVIANAFAAIQEAGTARQAAE